MSGKRHRHSNADMMGTLKRGSVYAKPYTRQLVTVFVLTIVVSLVSLVFPKLFGAAIDYARNPNDPNSWRNILPLLLVYALFLFLRAALMLSRNFLMHTTAIRITNDLRLDLFAHMQKLSLRFYEERQTGRIVSRVTEDAGGMHQLITGSSVTILGDLTMAAGVFFLIFFLNWKLALVCVSIVPLFVFNYAWHRRRMRLESRRHLRNWYRVVGFLHERIANNRVVRAFATEESEEDILRGGLDADIHNYSRIMWRNTLLVAFAEFLSGLAQLFGLAYGSWIILHDPTFTPGKLVAFLSYLGLLYTPIVRLFDANTLIQKGVSGMEKIFAILDTRPHIPENDALPEFPRMNGKIEFRDVSFGYRIGQSTLNHIQFSVAPGEMVALVGASGAGKSTIITLLSRFYDPTSGQIIIDDHPIVDYNVQSVRRQIGIVMQDNILFSGTIGDNIRYGRPDATQVEIIAAAQAANAHDFITQLRHGYNSRVGERGVSLSGGQRQRVAIARVLLKDPRILILDEATSALDSQAEKLIQDATEKLMHNRTAIVIAHRLSTVVNADRILVMDKGRIVDVGRHAELLARPGIYHDLYQLQFSDRAAA